MKRSIELLTNKEKLILAKQIVALVQKEVNHTEKAVKIVYDMIQ